jgi:hypothetical protein
MEDCCPEVGRGRLLRVGGWDFEVELPYSRGERGVCRTCEEDVELSEIVDI